MPSDQTVHAPDGRPWNKGQLIGQKRPLKPKDVWAIRVRLELHGSRRDVALFNLAIDSKLRACDLVRLKIQDVYVGSRSRERTTIIQKKTGRPVQFEISLQTRAALEALLESSGKSYGDYLFPSRLLAKDHLSIRQYARLVHQWVGDRLKRRDLKDKFKVHGTVPAPPRLAREVSQIVGFHTAVLPPKGFRRRKRWTQGTARTVTAQFGGILGALTAPPDRHVHGLGIPVAHLTMALFVFPDLWEWYLHWYEKRRGFFSNSEKNVLYNVKLLTRKPTGWIRQHPRLARRLKPIDGLISQKDINCARANWGAACDKVFDYAAARQSELVGVIRMHRDPFVAILPVLTNESPLREYKKIGDEILRRLPDERRSDDLRRVMAESTSVRNYLMFRFGLHLGLRQRNLRELLLCPSKQKHRDTSVLEDLQRGELRWNTTNKVWEVFVPAIAIKNGYAAFFRGRPFQATLPDLEGLYRWIDCYLKDHRSRLLNGCHDPQTFFVRTMRETGRDTELNITSYYAVWKLMIQKYGIYNPYTKRGAIKGLMPHGPHAVRDILATHLLKTTGSYELASFAIQDNMASVMKHYARFLPHEKIARAAEELNKVWRKNRTPTGRLRRSK